MNLDPNGKHVASAVRGWVRDVGACQKVRQEYRDGGSRDSRKIFREVILNKKRTEKIN